MSSFNISKTALDETGSFALDSIFFITFTEKQGTIFALITAHAPISTLSSNF